MNCVKDYEIDLRGTVYVDLKTLNLTRACIIEQFAKCSIVASYNVFCASQSFYFDCVLFRFKDQLHREFRSYAGMTKAWLWFVLPC